MAALLPEVAAVLLALMALLLMLQLPPPATAAAIARRRTPALAFSSAASRPGQQQQQQQPKSARTRQAQQQQKKKKKRGKPGSTAADLVAKRIGLRVVPKGYQKEQNKRGSAAAQTTSSSPKEDASISPAPTRPTPKPSPEVRIKWGRSAEHFFWGDGSDGSPTTPTEEENANVRLLRNDKGFPLHLVRNVLPSDGDDDDDGALSVSRAIGLVTGRDVMDGSEVLEQHEVVVAGGANGADSDSVRALRRSRVAHLDPHAVPEHGELLDAVLRGLPRRLTEDAGGTSAAPNSKWSMDGDGGVVDEEGHHRIRPPPHPYEDASIVYYRTDGRDYYDEHHDSYDPAEELRDRQRAYTVLLYLMVPPEGGGTEFTGLAPLPSSESGIDDAVVDLHGMGKKQRTRGQGRRGMVLKPRPGDVLVWPNFDREGRPYMDSVHRALPLDPKGCSSSDDAGRRGKHDGIGKIVVNLWFEGRLHKGTSSTCSS